MTLISPHCPPRSSCICLAKMGSGASGLAWYWNCLVRVNTSAPFRATLGQGHSWLIAVCNGIEPPLCRGSDATVSYTTTQPIHARGRWSEEWVNCTDQRYRLHSYRCSPLSTSQTLTPGWEG